jgi:CrcB protein
VSWLAVALAGAVGALTRYALGTAVGARSLPWTTLGINVSGSFLLAYLVAGPLGDRLTSPTGIGVTVGLLGAYTTFSTFGLETVLLVEDDRMVAAAGYVVASIVLGLAAAATGWWLGHLTTS